MIGLEHVKMLAKQSILNIRQCVPEVSSSFAPSWFPLSFFGQQERLVCLLNIASFRLPEWGQNFTVTMRGTNWAVLMGSKTGILIRKSAASSSALYLFRHESRRLVENQTMSIHRISDLSARPFMPEVELYDRPTKPAYTALISTLSTFRQACLGTHASDAKEHVHLSLKSIMSTSSLSLFSAYSVNRNMHIAHACTFTLSAPLPLYSCYQNQI